MPVLFFSYVHNTSTGLLWLCVILWWGHESSSTVLFYSKIILVILICKLLIYLLNVIANLMCLIDWFSWFKWTVSDQPFRYQWSISRSFPTWRQSFPICRDVNEFASVHSWILMHTPLQPSVNEYLWFTAEHSPHPKKLKYILTVYIL